MASLAIKVRSLYLAKLPTSQAVQQLYSVCVHEKDRLRAAALKTLTDNMAEYASDAADAKKSDFSKKAFMNDFINRFIFPAICSCLFSGVTKGEVKLNAGEALKALQRNLPGVRLWQWTDELLEQDEIKRLTS